MRTFSKDLKKELVIEVSGINDEFLNSSLLRPEQRGKADLVIRVVFCDVVFDNMQINLS